MTLSLTLIYTVFLIFSLQKHLLQTRQSRLHHVYLPEVILKLILLQSCHHIKDIYCVTELKLSILSLISST